MGPRPHVVIVSITAGLLLALDLKVDCKDVASAGLLDALWFAAGLALTQDQGGDGSGDGDGDGGGDGGTGLPTPGAPGAAGISCWDLNGNGTGEPPEDRNGDGNFDALDCQGAAGPPGPAGAAGQACWDLNGNGTPDANEDLNGDGNIDVFDCQGAPGQPGSGTPGQPGLSCWDSNANFIADTEEDVNEDGNFNALDCQGPAGQPGQACWDLNNNGNGDAEEDINNDGQVNVADCQGAPGEGGSVIVARAAIQANGQPFSPAPDSLISSELLETGVYILVVDISDVAPLPASKDEFVVLVSVRANLSEPGGGQGAPLTAFYTVESMNTEAQELSIRIDIIDAQTSQHNNSSFSFAVMPP